MVETVMTRIPEVELNTGDKIPAIGFGTWQIGGGEIGEALSSALEAGYRLIDTARIYGNEQGVGQAIRRSEIPREEIFVVTKLWTSDLGFDMARQAFEESMDRLGLEYLDLYLIHWPGYDPGRRREAWRMLSELNQEGFIKAIGVSNYEVSHLEEMLIDSAILPAVNQIEFHPFNYAEQHETLIYCREHDIVVEAYSPLARARQMENHTIRAIAQRYNKTSAQVMLRWAIQHGTVPIPKSSHPMRIRENLRVFDFELASADMEKLDALSIG